jgi:hypothetical protein
VNGDSDVVLGDNILLGHIQCLHLHRYYAEGLCAGVVVVRSRANDALQLAELAGLAKMIQGGNYLKDSSTEAFLHGDHRAATASEGNAETRGTSTSKHTPAFVSQSNARTDTHIPLKKLEPQSSSAAMSLSWPFMFPRSRGGRSMVARGSAEYPLLSGGDLWARSRGTGL